MKQIPLTKGYFALVDDEEYEFLSQFNWYAKPEKYTVYPKKDITVNGKTKSITMASMVMKVPPGIEVDHKDHNGLNAQKSNLRIATRSQQIANQRLRCTNKSGFKGIKRNRNSSKWMAAITIDGNRTHLGTFNDPREAARAYDEHLEKTFGDFAMTNKKLGLL